MKWVASRRLTADGNYPSRYTVVFSHQPAVNSLIYSHQTSSRHIHSPVVSFVSGLLWQPLTEPLSHVLLATRPFLSHIIRHWRAQISKVEAEAGWSLWICI